MKQVDYRLSICRSKLNYQIKRQFIFISSGL